jgi:hypothetical protein
MSSKLRFVPAVLVPAVIAPLRTPYWWAVPLMVTALALLAVVGLIVVGRLHYRMATKTDVTDWSFRGWKRTPPPSAQRIHQTRVRRRSSDLLPSWALVRSRQGTRMAEIKLDKNALRKIVQNAKPAIEKSAERTLQTAADEVWRRHTGQPVDKVRAAIKAHPTLRNVQFKDSTINDMAETIASGKRFHFRARVR